MTHDREEALRDQSLWRRVDEAFDARRSPSEDAELRSDLAARPEVAAEVSRIERALVRLRAVKAPTPAAREDALEFTARRAGDRRPWQMLPPRSRSLAAGLVVIAALAAVPLLVRAGRAELERSGRGDTAPARQASLGSIYEVEVVVERPEPPEPNSARQVHVDTQVVEWSVAGRPPRDRRLLDR